MTPLDYLRPVDSIPPDDEPEPEPEAENIQYQYQHLTEFRAVMAGARFDQLGNLVLSIRVPPQDKGLAVKVTDVRGVMMVFAVYEPIPIKVEAEVE